MDPPVVPHFDHWAIVNFVNNVMSGQGQNTSRSSCMDQKGVGDFVFQRTVSVVILFSDEYIENLKTIIVLTNCAHTG